jgi:hypothetical protein
MFSDPKQSIVVKMLGEYIKSRGLQEQAERTKSRKEKQKRKQRLTLLRGMRKYDDVKG